MNEIEERFWSWVCKRSMNECWYWDGHRYPNGYGQFHIERKPVYAHRFSWEVVHKRSIPVGMCILHTCNNKRCVNPYHLKLGTQAENISDYISEHGYNMRSGKQSKFYDGEIWLIKRLSISGISRVIISQMFRCSSSYISNIAAGRRGDKVR